MIQNLRWQLVIRKGIYLCLKVLLVRFVLTLILSFIRTPEEIIGKMVDGRLKKFYQEVVLLEQTFVIDNETKISAVIEKKANELGKQVELTGFHRISLGEGIEKNEADFASEVAATLGS